VTRPPASWLLVQRNRGGGYWGRLADNDAYPMALSSTCGASMGYWQRPGLTVSIMVCGPLGPTAATASTIPSASTTPRTPFPHAGGGDTASLPSVRRPPRRRSLAILPAVGRGVVGGRSSLPTASVRRSSRAAAAASDRARARRPRGNGHSAGPGRVVRVGRGPLARRTAPGRCTRGRGRTPSR
jgi:hypothetical protein